jgi:FolB domain-containing protein
MDTVTIQDLEVWYCVGVPDEERARPQRLALTVEWDLDCAPAAATDDLSRTIDYCAVTRRLAELGQGRSWKLIETLAVDIANLILGEFGASRVSVEIKKFILPNTRHVAVKVVRPTAC